MKYPQNLNFYNSNYKYYKFIYKKIIIKNIKFLFILKFNCVKTQK